MQNTLPRGWAAVARRVTSAALAAACAAGVAVAVAKPIEPVRSGALAAARAAVEKHRNGAGRPETRTIVVWRGQDVDGDGAADFANPTGAAPRGDDPFGHGGFGARRDGGARIHEGVDYAAVADQAVTAPISGFVTKIGFAYAGDTSLRFVEITNPAIGYVARAFYVEPTVRVGDALRLGDTIGRAKSLQSHYPGITDHVHLEILRAGGARLDATRLIAARTVKVPARA